jgi:3-oxoadipate enol-lactonase
VDLYVDAAGEGAPVVFVHAGICDSRMWEPQWAAFTAATGRSAWTCVASGALPRRQSRIRAALPGHAWSDEVKASWAEEEAALERGDLDAAVEVNLRMWVDGRRRPPRAVDPTVRERVGEMQRRAFQLQVPVGDQADEEALAPDVAARLGEIRAPALVVVGEEDVTDFHDIAERLAREIHDSRHATIAAAAHLPSLERPDVFNDLALDFLGKHLRR